MPENSKSVKTVIFINTDVDMQFVGGVALELKLLTCRMTDMLFETGSSRGGGD